MASESHGFASRSSVDRDTKSRSHSEDRSLAPGAQVEVEDNSPLAQALAPYDLDGFQIRPKFSERFSNVAVEQMIEVTLKEYFHQDKKRYHPDLADEWVAELGRILVGKMREFNYPRYKYVSYVVIGEKIGAGIHVGMKCLWDADSDSYATYTYMSDYLFCVATICAIFYY